MATIEVEGQQVPVENVPTQLYSTADRQQINQLRRSEDGKAAGAVVAANILGDFLGSGTLGPQASENATRALEDLQAQYEDVPASAAPAAPVVEVVAPAPVVADPVAAQTDYEIPDDLADVFADEPDEEEEPEPVAAQVEEEALPFDETDEFDPRITQLRKQAADAEKRAVRAEKLRVDAARPAWEADAKRAFVLNGVELVSDDELKGISAASHREFLRKAKAVADANKKVALRFAPQTVAAPAPEPVQQPRQEWGQPGVPSVDVGQSNTDYNDRIARARRSGNPLHAVIKEMIRGQ